MSYRITHADTGPLMKASSWLKKGKLSAQVATGEISNQTIFVGEIKNWDGKARKVAVLSYGDCSIESHFERGAGAKHSFYYDTGMGHKATDEMITIVGTVYVNEDTEVEKTTGDVDMNTSVNVLVFK